MYKTFAFVGMWVIARRLGSRSVKLLSLLVLALLAGGIALDVDAISSLIDRITEGIEIADEPITGLFGGIAVGGEATLGGTLDIDLVGGFTPDIGDEFEVLHWSSFSGAFGHIVDLAPHFTPDYRSDAFVLAVEEPPVVDYLDFSTLVVESYEYGQDDGTAEVLDAGATLRLFGNAWKKVELPTVIVPETVLEFDFQSSSEGEIHGIGFDTDDGMSPDRTFQLFGSQTWGIQDYATYVAPGVVHYEIPVGLFYTGGFDYLVFLTDDDSNASAESVFSNITIEVPSL
ncbi:MAG: hypothetical protein GY788_05950 [bacterium]|nr:hypothetical protein [bacterium]